MAVESIERTLAAKGVACYVDRWYLDSTETWQSALLNILKQSKSVAIFLGPGEMDSWRHRELLFALARLKATNLPVVTVLLPGADPPLNLMQLASSIDLRTSPEDDRLLTKLAAVVKGKSDPDSATANSGSAAICPFRGLLPYREEDAQFFFGRTDDIDRLTATLHEHTFIAVLGASGSGKSSVVRAGLVPRLRNDPKTVWEIATMVPTDRPFSGLLTALSPLLWPTLEDEIDRRVQVNKQIVSLEQGILSLRDLTEIALKNQPGTQRLLLIVDQWEELYTICRNDTVIRLFIAQLLETVQTAPLSVVFTCRADFYGQVLAYRPLFDRIQANAQVSLGSMSEDELREVIEAPAAKVGLEFEPGLTERILSDMGQEPGQLPLLSFLLEQLWNRRKGSILTNKAYDEMGGVEGAIATVAEELFQKLSEVDQKRLGKLFIHLVSVQESQDTRRRATLKTLDHGVLPLVDGLSTARLLVTGSEHGEETVEVAHESLIRHWDRSKAWINESRAFLTWRNRLEPFVIEWIKLDHDRTTLFRGGLLVEAQRWYKERYEDLDTSEREFIEASIAEKAEETEKELKRKGRLVALAISALSTAVLASILAAVAWNQWTNAQESERESSENAAVAKKESTKAQAERNNAQEEKRIAQEERSKAQKSEREAAQFMMASLANESEAIRNQDPDFSVIVAAGAVQVAKRRQMDVPLIAESSLRDALLNLATKHGTANDDYNRSGLAIGRQPLTWQLDDAVAEKSLGAIGEHRGSITAVAVSPDGRWLVTGSSDKTARIWDYRSKDIASSSRVLTGHKGSITALSISPDSRKLVTASDDNDARVWELQAENPEKTARVLSGHRSRVLDVKFSPDGRLIATGSDDNDARIWDVESETIEQSLYRLTGHDGTVASVAFSPDSRWLVTGSSDNTSRIWDLKSTKPEESFEELKEHLGSVSVVGFTPNGRHLVTGGEDNFAIVWKFGTTGLLKPAVPVKLEGHKGTIRKLAFSPNDRWLVTGSDDSRARVWDLENDQPESTAQFIRGQLSPVQALAFSSDGKWLISGSADGIARVWNVKGDRFDELAREHRDHEGSMITSLAISPDNLSLFTGSVDKTVGICKLDLKQPGSENGWTTTGQSVQYRVAISPDGKWLVAETSHGLLRRWDLSNLKEQNSKVIEIPRGDRNVTALGISRDGRWVARSLSNETSIPIWDFDSADKSPKPRILQGQRGRVSAIIFSRNGEWLVTCSENNNAHVWNIKNSESLMSPTYQFKHNGSFTSAVFSDDNRTLVTGSDDQVARIWEIGQSAKPGLEEPQRKFIGQESPVRVVALSPDGQRLATGGSDGNIVLWDLKQPQPETTKIKIPLHQGSVLALAFSADGTKLISGSDDNTARVSNLTDLSKIKENSRTLRGHKKPVRVVSLLPNGWGLTASEGGAARRWPLDIEDLLKHAALEVNRNPTKTEFNKLFPDLPYKKVFDELPEGE